MPTHLQVGDVSGGGGGHTIQDEGSSLTARTGLNFTGAGVTATDDAANNRTNVTISGSGGGAGDGYVINVKSAPYSATGNGSTNDTAAVQAAIDAAEAAGGGIVYFPLGTYLCNGLTIAGNNITLLGAGWGSVLRQVSGAADNTYLVSVLGTTTNTTGNYTDLAFRDLQFLGRIDTDAATQYVHLLAVSGVTDCHIERCLFKGWRGDGVYIGSGNSTQVERHNERVWIEDCTFDGVNKLNRNALTVIDGTGLWIRDNHFRNCSATDRPGAIDLEMNDNAYHRLRNVQISGNEFENVGGNVGNIVVDIFRTQASLTVPIRGIVIEGNTIRGSTNSQGAIFVRHRQTPTATTVPTDITIRDNEIVDCVGTCLYVEGARGVEVEDNRFGTSPNALAFGYAYATADISFRRNRLYQVGTTEGTAIDFYSVARMQIEDNVFDSIGVQAGGTGRITSFVYNASPASTSSAIEMDNNRIVGTTHTTISSKNASHTLSQSTNRFGVNFFGTLVADAAHWLKVATGASIHNGSAYVPAARDVNAITWTWIGPTDPGGAASNNDTWIPTA
jgi:hypothetical protein